jgi:hypothetical protein
MSWKIDSKDLIVIVLLLSAVGFSLLILLWKVINYYLRVRSVYNLHTMETYATRKNI